MHVTRLAAPVAIETRTVSAFRRFLTGLGRRPRRLHMEPAGSPPSRPSLGPGRDPNLEQVLVRLRDCVCTARELVPPSEWNAKLEWILGSGSDSTTRDAELDRETIYSVVLGLEDLAESVSRASVEPEDPLRSTGGDGPSRQAVARGLRDVALGCVLASGLPIPTGDSIEWHSRSAERRP